MASGETAGQWTGTASGAVSGATMGSSFGPWGTAIGGVVGGLAGYFAGGSSGRANDAQAYNQAAWGRYNANMGYNISMNNIMAQGMIAGVNARATMAAASVNSKVMLQTAQYNMNAIAQTTRYNSSLLDEELALMWEATDLDLTMIQDQRARERGTMLSVQAASGTVMNQDSNFDVIVAQKTMEAQDMFVVQHNGEIAAANILNQKAQGKWEGAVAMQKLQWEGQLGSWATMANARIQAGAGLASAAISGMAGQQSAMYQRDAGLAQASMNFSNYQTSNTNSMVSGLFSTAGQAAKVAANLYQPGSGSGSGSGSAGSSLITGK